MNDKLNTLSIFLKESNLAYESNLVNKLSNLRVKIAKKSPLTDAVNKLISENPELFPSSPSRAILHEVTKEPVLPAEFDETTFGDDTEDEIGPSIRKVLQSMLPADLVKLNNDMGYADPFTTFKIQDEIMGEDKVEFSFGGEKFSMTFNKDRTPKQIVQAMETVIKDGIKNMNKKRGKATFKTQMDFEEWKKDTDEDGANPEGSVLLKDYYEWLRTN